MKICRYGSIGKEKPGIIDNKNNIRDLSHILTDFSPKELSQTSLKTLQSLDINTLPIVNKSVRLGIPINHISKCICVGLNYEDHAKEAGLEIPKEPILFLKAPSSLCGAYDDTIIPPNATQLDWEVELAIIIGTKAQSVPEETALSYVAGYSVFNDISERTFQMQSSQWDKGKGCDRFGPLGPYLVTKDEIPDPQNLNLWLDVNGIRRQYGSTKTMIFTIEKLISYISHYMTLLPGDVIATGTPPGVGMGFKPPIWLKKGDNVHLGIDGLGEQKQKIIT